MVTLYCASTKTLSSPEIFDKYYNMLDAERQTRIKASAIEKNKRQLVAAGALLLRAFGREAKYERDERGKPCLIGGGMHFNISHSGDIAILAVSQDEVGCDVQFKGAFSRVGGKLSAPERAMIARTLRTGANAVDVQSECDDLLRRIWAAKESYVKAIGEGLRRPLRSYTVRLMDDVPHVDDPETGKRYYLKEYNLKDYFDFADGYACFCCSPYNGFLNKVIVETLD